MAVDYPTAAELQTAIDSGNAENLAFSGTDNALLIQEAPFLVTDSDADGVPDPADDCDGVGWRLPCDGDASNDGIFETLSYDASGATTIEAGIDVPGFVEVADVYILVDTSQSMGPEIAQIITDLTSGTFVDTAQCPEGAGTGLVGGLKCIVPDLWIGLGGFEEYPLWPHAYGLEQAPYHHYLDLTDNLQHINDALWSLTTRVNKDNPDAISQAIYATLTGKGLGPWVPNRGSCPEGHWGYPCFRPNSLPILLLITDSPAHEEPTERQPEDPYLDPPFDGVVGLGQWLPPVEMSPNVLYSSDKDSAWDLGDLTGRSLTVMGTNTNMGNDAVTWTEGACTQCSSGCWSDGQDAFAKFSLSSTVSAFFSGIGTGYPYHNVALFDGDMTPLDCDPGPGSGDYWGRFTRSIGPGTYYAVSDAAVPVGLSSSDVRGPYQLRIQTTVGDSSWQTATAPIHWDDVETTIIDTGAKMVSIASFANALDSSIGLANASGSFDDDGVPFVERINDDGTGLSDSTISAIDRLINNTRRDGTVIAEDNAATPTVDESEFLKALIATNCPTTGTFKCLSGTGTDTCVGCQNKTNVGFDFTLGNSTVPETAGSQTFDFDLVGIADGKVELRRVPVRILVPGNKNYGAGYYQNTYEADAVCRMPPDVPDPDVPDWGTLTWSGSAPAGTSVEFQLFTANTVAELDTVTPVSIVYPTETTEQSYDVGEALEAGGGTNMLPFLRVKVVIQGSSNGGETPVFEGWSMQFNCLPAS
jgi:hypothetical protein